MTDHRVLLGLYLVLAVWAVLMQYFSGPGHNNFDIYSGVARHFFAERPLFGPSPAEYADMNHYGPLFAFIIAPFVWLPHLMGVMLWVCATGVVFWWAVRQLPITATAQAVILLLCSSEFYNAAAYQQFNTVTVAMIILSFTYVMGKREWLAALLIVIGTMVKLYGVVGLAFFFFIEPDRRWKFVGYLALCTVLLFGLQIVCSSWGYVVGQYSAWLTDIEAKNLTNLFSPYQNRGFIGMVRKVTGVATYSDLWLIGAGLVVYGASLLRWKRFKETRFRLLMLASTLLFVVLFSSGTETCSYITAMAGIGIWWFADGSSRTGRLDWALLIFVMIGSLANGLFPPPIYLGVIFPYALKALPFTLVWIKISCELLFVKQRL